MNIIKKYIAIISIIGACLVASSPAFCKVVYVSKAGSDSNDGLSWGKAKATVSAGLTGAVSGDEVWVAAGTYVERAMIQSGIALYGGFAGNETARDQRNWRTNVTILDGNKNTTMAVVSFATSASTNTIVDGFTIQNGAYANGAGIKCATGYSVISNNIIKGNSGNLGGGISASGSARIVNNLIQGNIAITDGAGIYCSNTSATAVIANNIICGNNMSPNTWPLKVGGAGICTQGPCVITNNTIALNVGWGINCKVSGSPAISNNIIAYNYSGITATTATPVLRNNCIYNPDGSNYTGLSAGTADISAEPKFAGWRYGDLRLMAGSPCIDAGWNGAQEIGSVDFYYHTRVQPSGGTVDIGAEECDGSLQTYTPRVVYVSQLGNDANDGSSWNLAKGTVQAGINAAGATGGEVWVAQGVYVERITFKPCVHVYGGFSGSESDRSARNWRANSTVLDGGAGGAVVTISATGWRQAAIDGFTIRNGNGTTGSGISCQTSAPTIANNIITGNAGQYGAIYCVTSAPLILSNRIINNNAVSVGGLRMGYCINPVVSGNLIAGNQVPVSGHGGVYGENTLDAVFTNNTAAGNSGSGIYLNRCTAVMANNIAAHNLFGIYFSSSTVTTNNNCFFSTDSTQVQLSATDILADPLMAGWQSGNYHIQPDSPCKNAGWNGAPRLLDKDIDGQDRILPSGGTVDIGADESDDTCWAADDYVFYVSPGGDDSNDGKSWANAKKTIQAAVDTAMPSCGEVWVKSGTYNERIVPNETITSPLAYKPCVYLYGGFAGTETQRTQRNPSANTTTIDGGGQGSVITTENMTNWLSGVDGFVITGGTGMGAGILCNGTSPTISHNTITGNGGLVGGGIYVAGGSPTIINNVISGNTASNGGGISSFSPMTAITGNTISGNTAANGGGLYLAGGSEKVTNNILRNNICTTKGGAIFVLPGIYMSPLLISNNAIISNRGSGIFLPTTSSSTTSNLAITNNTVINNDGPGVECVSSTYYNMSLSNNIIAYNQSVYSFGYGSGTVTLRNNCYCSSGPIYFQNIKQGTGDIIADPRLADGWWQNGIPHIQPDSPCKDTGWNSATGITSKDIDNQPRIQPAGGTIDIGADESDGTVWPWYNPITVYVSLNGNDQNDGLSWASAKKTIQAGVKAASFTRGEVWVAKGTYKENISLARMVSLFGGFQGTETSLPERPAFPRPKNDPNATIIDGDKKGSVISCILLGDGGVIDGFTIQNGSGTTYYNADNDFYSGNPIYTPSGGGILCDNSSPAISHCTIVRNTANYGAGIYLKSSSAHLTDNIISNNNSSYFGAGLYAIFSSSEISNNIISDNHGYWVGGISLWRCDPVTVSENIIEHNLSDMHGGGMSIVLSRSTVSSNIVRNNSAPTGWGGGIDLGLGGIATLSGNLIIGNNAQRGGGVWMDASQFASSPLGLLKITLTNNSILSNSAGLNGGGWCTSSSPTVTATNNLIAFNSSGLYGAGAITLANNDVYNPGSYNYSGLSKGPSDISADPLLIGGKTGTHLSRLSPCINAGSNAAPGLLDLDIDGQRRIHDGTVDIGADEWYAGIIDAKSGADGMPISMCAEYVTAAFPDFFYIESRDRSAGIRVEKQGHNLAAGMRADIDGVVSTSLPTGERAIIASSAAQNGSGKIMPFVMNNKAVGGDDVWGWIPVRQPDNTVLPVWKAASGLANIGLFVTTTGKITYSGAGFFYVDDGSGLDDNSGHKGVKVLGSVPVGAGVDPVGKYVIVTGISSLEKPGSDPVRLILTRGPGDVVVQ